MQHLTCRQDHAASLIKQTVQTGHNSRTSNQRRFLQLADPTVTDGANQRALYILEAVLAGIRTEVQLLAEQFCHALSLGSIRLRNARDSHICVHRVNADIGGARQVLEQLGIDALRSCRRIDRHHVANEVVHLSACIAGNEGVRQTQTGGNSTRICSLTDRRVTAQHDIRHRTLRTTSFGNQMADGNNFLRQDIVIANLRDKTLLFLGQNTILISKRTNKLSGGLERRNLRLIGSFQVHNLESAINGRRNKLCTSHLRFSQAAQGSIRR